MRRRRSSRSPTTDSSAICSRSSRRSRASSVMSEYHAPLADMRFVLNELAGLADIAKLPGFEDATPDTVAAILDEASRFATEVLDPLNASGDREGSKLTTEGTVRTPQGFRDAYLR